MKNKPSDASKSDSKSTSAPATEPSKPKPGETPWTAIVVIGAVVALGAFAATRGNDVAAGTDGGATTASSAAADGSSASRTSTWAAATRRPSVTR